MPSTSPLINDKTVRQIRQTKERLMTHTCTVKQSVETTDRDGDNQKVISTAWVVVGQEGRKCKLNRQSVTVTTGENQTVDQAIVMGRFKLDFPYGSEDITIKHRIYDLRDRDGNLVDPTVPYFEIKELIPSDYDVEFAIQAIH